MCIYNNTFPLFIAILQLFSSFQLPLHHITSALLSTPDIQLYWGPLKSLHWVLLYRSLTVHYFCFRSEFDSDFVSTSTYELSSVHVRSSTIFASAVVAAPYATVRTPLQVAFHVLALTKIGSRSKCQIKSAEFYCIAEFYLLMEY